MALAPDATSSGHDETGASTLTVAHTCTGSNLILIVCLMLQDDGGNTTNITDVTYNGVSMTAGIDYRSGTTSERTVIYYLANPATGTHNIVVTPVNATNYKAVGAISFTGASGTVGGTGQQTQKNDTTFTASLTATVNGNYLVDCFHNESKGAQTITKNAAQSLISSWVSANHFTAHGSSYKAANAGAVSMNWTNSNSHNGQLVALEVLPLVATDWTKTLGDTIALSDSRKNAPNKILADTMTLADSLAKVFGVFKTDSLSVVEDSHVAGFSFLNTVLNKNETLTISDSKTELFGKILTDSQSITDALLKTVGKKISDSQSITDALSKTTGLNKVDSLTLADAIVKTIVHNVADSMTLADAISTVAVHKLSISDTIALADAISKAIISNKSDIVSLVDVVQKTFGLSKRDTITFAESIAKQIGRVNSEILAIVDSNTKTMGHNLNDTLTLIDSIATFFNHVQAPIFSNIADIYKKKSGIFSNKQDIFKGKRMN